MKPKLIFAMLSIWMGSSLSCLSTGEQTNSITIASHLGQGFGKVMTVEGIPCKKIELLKSPQFIRFIVSKINGNSLDTPITVPIQMLNSAAEQEFAIFNDTESLQPIVLIGYESFEATGVPHQINCTIETMEQIGAWNFRPFFVVVRASDKIGNWPRWPRERDGVIMNQVLHITHEGHGIGENLEQFDDIFL